MLTTKYVFLARRVQLQLCGSLARSWPRAIQIPTGPSKHVLSLTLHLGVSVKAVCALYKHKLQSGVPILGIRVQAAFFSATGVSSARRML